MSRPLIDILNESNPNKVADADRIAQMGNALALSARTIRATVTTNVLTLPEGAKAAAILRCFATTGASTGNKAPVAPETTPAAGQCAVTPTGDVAFANADAVTQAEVTYIAAESGGVFEDVLSVAASTATLLQGRVGLVLLSATVEVGIVLGAVTIVARGATPAATQAALGATGATIAFNAADVITGRVRVRYIARPDVGGAGTSLNARLASQVDL
jgi:hypothetical protein